MNRVLITGWLVACFGCSTSTASTSSASGGRPSTAAAGTASTTGGAVSSAGASTGGTSASTGATASASSTSGSTSTGGGPDAGGIPSTFFGMHVNHIAGFPVKVPFGYFRQWDNWGGQWQTIETCDPAVDAGPAHDAGCFAWTNFDDQMALLKDAGVDETLFTLSRTPAWAFPDAGPGAVTCDYGGNTCFPPSDLASDGSGPDLIWIGWVAALADHVNAPGYAATHAHIHMYEPWNEFYRSDILSGSTWSTVSFQGTYAQIVRMTEDLRCVIKGVGSIHNVPVAGQSIACSQLLTQLGRTAVDPAALITTPSGNFDVKGSERYGALQSFLYCNDPAAPRDAGCTTGDAGSAAVDVIDFHYYPSNATPEYASVNWIAVDRMILSSADAAKPLIAGEGSWGPVATGNGGIWQADAYARAGFIPRYLASGWSDGLSQMFWYAYDNSEWGQLYADDALTTVGADGGHLQQPEATGWRTAYAWLIGAVPTQRPFCQSSGTVYTCDFLQGGRTPSRLVWDVGFGPQTPLPDGGFVDAGVCSQWANPWVCGDARYVQDAGFSTVENLSGSAAEPIADGTVTIGANPILLQ